MSVFSLRSSFNKVTELVNALCLEVSPTQVQFLERHFEHFGTKCGDEDDERDDDMNDESLINEWVFKCFTTQYGEDRMRCLHRPM